MTTTTAEATWTVAYAAPSGMLTEHAVTAAYFNEDDRLTVFKDRDNKAVYAVRTDSLVSISRARIEDQIMAAFRQALRQADEEQGPATVGFRNGDADSATETGYDITVVRIN